MLKSKIWAHKHTLCDIIILLWFSTDKTNCKPCCKFVLSFVVLNFFYFLGQVLGGQQPQSGSILVNNDTEDCHPPNTNTASQQVADQSE